MKDINTYLTFDGDCREAMTFYKGCLDAELDIRLFSDIPEEVPAEAKDRVAHARLTKGSAVLMASDTMPGIPFQLGNNFSVSLNCESQREIETFFSALAENGKVTMPLQDVFWGAHFGMLTDRFGINWMFSLEKTKQ